MQFVSTFSSRQEEDDNPISGFGTTSLQDYIAGLEYIDHQLTAYYHAEGRMTPTESSDWQYEYTLTDHLGNSRISFTDSDGDNQPEILQENHYYPFGMTIAPLSQSPENGENKYPYNGKEHHADLGLNWTDYGARWSDAQLGRWHSVDPLADHPNQVDKSSYAYAWSNPVLLTDPDGRCPICPFIAKGVTGAAVDYFMQGAVNYGSRMDVEAAFSPSNIAKTDVFISGLQGAFPWSIPGGKYGKSAGVAVSDVVINAGKATLNGEEYSAKQAGKDFLVGFISQLGAEKAGEFFKENNTTIGRWMSENELDKMKKSGQVQEGAGGQTYGSIAGSDDYRKTAKKGSVYVEYDVESKSVISPAGKKTWVKTLGDNAPNSQKYRLNKQGGKLNPSIKNIKVKDKKQ